MVGAASEGIAKLAAQGKCFDLAFLDADKTGYLGYYKQVCRAYNSSVIQPACKHIRLKGGGMSGRK